MPAANPNHFPGHSLREMTEILIKHHNVHEGRYELSIEFRVAIGTMGPSPEEVLPSGMIGVSGMALAKVADDVTHAHVVDAANVNPKKPPRSRTPKIEK